MVEKMINTNENETGQTKSPFGGFGNIQKLPTPEEKFDNLSDQPSFKRV